MGVDAATREQWAIQDSLREFYPSALLNPSFEMRVIGITGAAGHGKDTVAKFILEHVKDAKRQGFADMLKLSVARLFNPYIEQEDAIAFCEWLKHEGDVSLGDAEKHVSFDVVSGRSFLQRYGTEAHRDVFGEDFWLDAVLPDGRNDCGLLVIPDVRFSNEAFRVRERGGEVWHVFRPNFDGELQGLETEHPSESSIPEHLITGQIVNDGTLEELREKTLDHLRLREG